MKKRKKINLFSKTEKENNNKSNQEEIISVNDNKNK